MKNTICLTLLLLFIVESLSALHNYGGRIEYKHISGFSYEASIITYTEISTLGAPYSLPIDWGDGTLETIYRTSQEVVEAGVWKNVYTKIHTYANSGRYTMRMEDPNRDDNILNINGGNSVNVPLYIESDLVISITQNNNNSAIVLNEPIITGSVGQILSFTPTAYDPDGDILTFELVTPKEGYGITVPGYQLITDISPGANNQFSFDQITGTLTWNSPQQAGKYAIAIKISECRNGQLTGTTLVDYQIEIFQTQNIAWLNEPSGVDIDTIAVNDTVELRFSYYNGQSVDSVDLTAHSEVFINGNTGTFLTDSVGVNYLEKTFRWVPDSLSARCAPYVITVRGSSYFVNKAFRTDKRFVYYVRSANTQYCDTVCNDFNAIPILSNSSFIGVQVAPNPFKNQTQLFLEGIEPTKSYRLSLFTVLGKPVLEVPVTNGDQVTLERGNLPAGVYGYQIRSRQKVVAVGKLMVVD